MIRFALRFLWAVSPHFRQASVVLASVAVFGVWTATAFPGDVGAPYCFSSSVSYLLHRLAFVHRPSRVISTSC